MKKRLSKSGMTLVEVMVAVFLVGVAAAIVYTEMLLSYRILLRSRARLESQSLAFDRLWESYNIPKADLPGITTVETFSTPADSVLSTNGIVERTILPNVQTTLPDNVEFWDIVVEVWPPAGSPIQVGTNSLARYAIRRYQGER